MAVSARFGLFGVELTGPFAWLASTEALAALTMATVAELAADKIPFVDHALSVLGTVTKPAAGALAAAAAFTSLDPAAAAIAGLIIGAPVALAVHSAQAATRMVSTATTGGLGNPLISLVEDVAAFGGSMLALAAPLLVPLAFGMAALFAWRVIAAGRRARLAWGVSDGVKRNRTNKRSTQKVVDRDTPPARSEAP